MYNLRAIFVAFIQHWKTTTSSFWSLSFMVGILPQVAVFGWMASKNPDASVFSYLLIGAPLRKQRQDRALRRQPGSNGRFFP